MPRHPDLPVGDERREVRGAQLRPDGGRHGTQLRQRASDQALGDCRGRLDGGTGRRVSKRTGVEEISYMKRCAGAGLVVPGR